MKCIKCKSSLIHLPNGSSCGNQKCHLYCIVQLAGYNKDMLDEAYKKLTNTNDK